MKTMKFELDQAVAIKISGDGRATHAWFDEADLDPVV